MLIYNFSQNVYPGIHNPKELPTSYVNLITTFPFCCCCCFEFLKKLAEEERNVLERGENSGRLRELQKSESAR